MNPKAELLADRLLLMAIDDRSGKLLASSDVLGLTLAGGLLVELLLTRYVALDPYDMPVVHSRWDVARTRPSFHHDILTTMCGEPNRLDLETWVAYLAKTALGWTCDRLERAGLLRKEWNRLRPVNSADAAEPRIRLTHKLTWHEPLDTQDLTLLALTVHTGLRDVVIWQNPDRDTPLVDAQLHRLRTDPWLHPLHAVTTAVDHKISRRAFAH
jgi:Golgi phosphoprotein 3 (GPP34)